MLKDCVEYYKSYITLISCFAKHVQDLKWSFDQCLEKYTEICANFNRRGIMNEYESDHDHI